MAGYTRTQAHPVNSNDSGLVILSGASALSEFAGYTGDCGQCALEVARAIIQHEIPDSNSMNSMVRDMIRRGTAANQGQTSLEALRDMAQRLGITMSLNHDWRGVLGQNATQIPIVLGIGNGGSLPGEHPGLKGHFITVVGLGPKGYAVADGNTIEARSGTLVYYTESELAQAQPWGALYPAQGSFSTSPVSDFHPAFTQQNDISPGSNANMLLVELPGFAGIVAALDAAEKFQPYTPPSSVNPFDTVGYTAQWGIKNSLPAAVRFLLILFGAGLAFMLIMAAVRAGLALAVEEAEPEIKAGLAIGALL